MVRSFGWVATIGRHPALTTVIPHAVPGFRSVRGRGGTLPLARRGPDSGMELGRAGTDR